jgi:hypothetical protein
MTDQQRLFACACCRLVWHLFSDERSRKAVEVSERYADGFASQQELETAISAAHVAYIDFQAPYLNDQVPFPGDAAFYAPAAAIYAIEASPFAAVAETGEIGDKAMYLAQSNLIGDIFGNPFCPIAINPDWLAWNDGLLVSMAHKMYDSRDFRDMPVLADALEDAGCDNADIVIHCRHPSEHVRGCWVVDLILEKA